MTFPHPLALLVRLLLSLLGITFAVGFPLYYGYEQSYSRYFSTHPSLFVGTLALLATGLFMHKNKKWIFPAGCLMLVAMCDMYTLPFIHYSAALVFFVTGTWAMYKDKRISGFGKCSILLYPLLVFDLIWFELLQILLICIFHIAYIVRTYILMRAKNS